MCGIAGIYRPGGEPISHQIIRSMTDAIRHRGPDDEGYFVDNDIALGHRRLSVIDLTVAGSQPMSTDDGNFVLVYNGEIYNFQELRLKLKEKGYRFQSKTDSEVILHGYREWGLDIIPMLNGMFAFGLWDHEKRSLILARDRFGIKPLYIWHQGKKLVFGSEIKAILQYPGYSIDVNYDALNEYFSFQNLFRFHTLFDGIQMLAPARVFIMNQDGGTSSYSYWDYNFTDRDENLSEEEAQCETLRLFKQAVQRQMVADVPVGSYLSGGMDSGSITSVASQQTPRLATFTCGFDMSTTTGREANFDERRDAELMASHLNTEHYEQVINATDLSWSLPRVIWHLEDLRVGMSYPNYYIARLASKFVKVCLSGAGGDELYGGYPWRYYRVFQSVGQEEFFRQYYDFWQRLVPDDEKKDLFTGQTYRNITEVDEVFNLFRRVFTFNKSLKYDRPEDHIANSLYFEAKTFLSGLFIVGDKLAMASSLEERFPFMDNDLVDFAQKTPIRYKLGNFEKMTRIDENTERKLKKFKLEFDDGKNVLRKAMSSLIPSAIIDRKKQGFSAPDESWYRRGTANYVQETLLDKRAAYRDFIDQNYVKKILEEHTDQKINHRLLIWSFLCFEWWCKIFLDGYKP